MNEEDEKKRILEAVAKEIIFQKDWQTLLKFAVAKKKAKFGLEYLQKLTDREMEKMKNRQK